MQKINIKNKDKSLIDMLEGQYKKSDRKGSISYWSALSNLIIECVNLRDMKDISQLKLAQIMNTRQSVISRFENMGRKPNYDFIARLSQSLGHQPGMTLLGDFMAVVPYDQLEIVKKMANKENISTKDYVQKTLEEGISKRIDYYNKRFEVTSDNTSVGHFPDYTNEDEISNNLYSQMKQPLQNASGEHDICDSSLAI